MWVRFLVSGQPLVCHLPTCAMPSRSRLYIFYSRTYLHFLHFCSLGDCGTDGGVGLSWWKVSCSLGRLLISFRYNTIKYSIITTTSGITIVSVTSGCGVSGVCRRGLRVSWLGVFYAQSLIVCILLRREHGEAWPRPAQSGIDFELTIYYCHKRAGITTCSCRL